MCFVFARARFKLKIMEKQIAFAAWHDPLAPGTWSGTPSNIARAWDGRVQIVPLACRPSSAKVAARYAWDKARGHNTRFSQRRMAAQGCARLSATLPDGCAGIVHMNTWTMPFEKPRDAKIKHFLLVDSLCKYWQECGSNPEYSARDWAEYEADDQNAIDNCDFIFSISAFIKEMLVSHYGVASEKIAVVGTGRGSIKPLETVKSYAGKNVMMIAKDRFLDKGGDTLVKAVALARKTDPKITLTLVSPLEHEMLVGQTEGVSYTGRLPWDELQGLFDTSALFAMPAPAEPWGLSYVEALVTKTPVLGLNRAALPEITRNGQFGFLVDEATPEAIASSLLDALGDPARLERMGREGQAHILEGFSWEQTAAHMEKEIWK